LSSTLFTQESPDDEDKKYQGKKDGNPNENDNAINKSLGIILILRREAS
jgi:hypothetical protein